MPQPDLTNASEAIHVWKELKAGRQLTRSVSPPLLSAYVSGTCHVSMCVSVSCSFSFLSQISLSDFWVQFLVSCLRCWLENGPQGLVSFSAPFTFNLVCWFVFRRTQEQTIQRQQTYTGRDATETRSNRSISCRFRLATRISWDATLVTYV